ncbi:MAG TPA: lanthionine synthetase LanC family protein, partial [Tahibacter sp.]|nr:lanthionine synthetase LanC family protein [Tahibacter sp.]
MNSLLEPVTTTPPPAAHAPHASPLGGALREAVWDYCRELAAACRADSHEFEGTGLARGRIGPAQFLAAWHRATGDADARDAALAHAQATLETMGGDPLRFDWIGGLTGTTWALRRIAWLDDEPLDPDFSDEIDRTLTLRLGVAQWTGDYDLISGVVGDGLYALDHPDRAWRDRLVGAALAHLVKLARTNENGTTWFTEPHLLP